MHAQNIQSNLEKPKDSIVSIVKGQIQADDIAKIIRSYTYDPESNRYVYSFKYDDYDIEYPKVLTRSEYEKILMRANMLEYYQKKIAAKEGKLSEEEQNDLLPKFYVNNKLFESIFGGNTIEIKPTGNLALDLGLRYTKQDNPMISPRNRSTFALDFQPTIGVGIKGKVGKNLDVNINYDTQATMGFQSQMAKLKYKANEDDIIQALEVGNVTMPVKNSLIRGASNLFGVKTELQFGPTTVTGVVARQQSQRNTVQAEGGGMVQDFEIFALDYDRDKHFFLSQYFRNQYDKSLENYPYINTRVRITRVEVWVTNRQNRVNDKNNNQRNIVALQDLGESQLQDVDSSKTIGLDLSLHPDFINVPVNKPTANENNKFDPTNIGLNYLNENIRQINSAAAGFNIQVIEGSDFVKLENARKLSPNEFKFHPQLGYISLRQSLSNDEVLAVSYEYTIGNKIYKVGEFATDGVDSVDQGTGNDEQDIPPTSQSLIVKLLKSNLTSTNAPIWNLMMKNIYKIGMGGLSSEGFRFNILYTDPSPLNYIQSVANTPLPDAVRETPLLNVFNLDRLNANNDPQIGGDGYFDYVANQVNNALNNQNDDQRGGNRGQQQDQSNIQNNTLKGVTIDEQNGLIIFTNVEPFGGYLFKKLETNQSESYDDENTYNENQKKYVYRSLYTQSFAKAREDSDRNKFQLKGKIRTNGADGIRVGFNLQPGSVVVTAGGRMLQEGVDFTVDYQGGLVKIIDPSLQNSDTPIQISTESSNGFNLQTRNFYGLDIEHTFSDKFSIGGTAVSLVEQPFTVKSMHDNTSVSNSMYGLNFNYQNEVPFLTRWVNKLPNIDTDVPSSISLRGEFAYLRPGASDFDQMNNEATAYIDNFEATQVNIDLLSPLQWKMSSVPVGFGQQNTDISSGYKRARLSWYSIDRVFYSSVNRPEGIEEADLASNKTRRIYKKELYPNMDIANGDLQIIRTLDLSYYPKERGPYNFNPEYLANNNSLPNPVQNWGGIMRNLTLTNFENANIEYIEFWMMDPYVGNQSDVISDNNTGKLFFNLGYISEDILQDGFKQYENGLPTPNDDLPTISTIWGKVPASTALLYAFDNDTSKREYQDIGLDGISDEEEVVKFPQFAQFEDPAADNYEYFLNTGGDIVSRYKNFNNHERNNMVEFSDSNRANNNKPDVEDIDSDNTMNTINAYFQYEVPIDASPVIGQNFVVDIQNTTQELNNGTITPVRWVQYKIPVEADEDKAVGAISDLQSIRFMRMYLTGFSDDVTLRFGSLNLARSDWRRYKKSLVEDPTIQTDGTNTGFDVTTVNVVNNSSRQPIPYVLPPGIVREKVNRNNTVVNQNEQALSLKVYQQSESNIASKGLEPGDSRAVIKNMDFDMRQYKKMRLYLHAEALENADDQTSLQDDELVAFIRFGNDFLNNYYQIEIPLKTTEWGTFDPEDIWPLSNEIELKLELLNKIKVQRNNDPNQDPSKTYFKDEIELDPTLTTKPNQLRVGIKGTPNFGQVRSVMLGIRNNSNILYANTPNADKDVRGEVWFNELRMSDLDDRASWATNLNLDAQVADFATLSASANYSTVGFGSIEQMPQERSKKELLQYSVNTAINAHQLLPKKWKLNVPISYAISEERSTPQFDPANPDLRLNTALEYAQTDEERNEINKRAIDYTKRTSINLVGVKKDLGEDQKPQFYNIENFTFSHTFNKVEKTNFEVESFNDLQSRSSVDYNYSFKGFKLEPFKNAKKLKKNKYLKWLTGFELSPLPKTVQFNTQINRQFNSQKFRLIDISGLEIKPLFKRNYFFDYNYGLTFNLTRSLSLEYKVNNHNVVKNYFFDDGRVDYNNTIWDQYFDIGTPNNRQQQFDVNYRIPINKFPFMDFVKADYGYTSTSSWLKSSDSFSSINYENQTYSLGNTIENTNTHSLNVNLSMDKLYKTIGLVPIEDKSKLKKKKRKRPRPGERFGDRKNEKDKKGKKDNKKGKKKPSALLNALINIASGVKNIRTTYNETNGMVLPGYLPTIGFFGSAKPTLGFVFGNQQDIRQLSADNNWLTTYPEFNQVYSQVNTKKLNFTADYRPFNDFTIDFKANRKESYQLSEQFDVSNGTYNSRAPYEMGFFSMTNNMIATSFLSSGVNSSAVFDQFKKNRQIIAQRLATKQGIDLNDANNYDDSGFPIGYGKTSQQVLIPSFLAAYQGEDVSSVSLDFFRKIPIPSWNLRYTGLSKIKLFKKYFKRITLQHGYSSQYVVGNYQTNYDFIENPEGLNTSGNYPSKIVASNINMVERFSPLARLDLQTRKGLSFVLSVDKNRMLSMSFDNNLLTEVQGMDYKGEIGFRIKDLAIQTDFRGVGQNGKIVSDLLCKIGFSWQKNYTIIRYLDYDNNQIGAGRDFFKLDANAEYKFSKNFTGVFYYEHSFSNAVISTQFPVTNVRSGFSLRYNL